LRWLGDRHADTSLLEAASRIEKSVELTLSQGLVIPRDLGGQASCTDVTAAICRNLQA